MPYVFRRTTGLLATGLLGLAASLLGAEGTGFVGIANKDGVWWFTAPDGRTFLSVGANHIEGLYWQSPNNREFVRLTYGPDLVSTDGQINEGGEAVKKWAANVARSFESAGFNTFGFHNPLSPSLRAASKAYYVVELDLHTPWGWNMTRPQLLQAMRRRPTDIFGEAFRQSVEANAAEFVKPRATDPMLLGYAYTDGPPWTVSDGPDSIAVKKLSAAERVIHPWNLALMSLPANAAGKQAWLALMKTRYPSAEKAGATYGRPEATWESLGADTDWRKLSDAKQAAADSVAFLDVIMRQWYSMRHAAIRKHDPHHLILGDKLNLGRDHRYPDELARSLEAMQPFVDVINIQYYAPAAEQIKTLGLLHRLSGKPILNGDTACNPLWEDNPITNTDFYGKLGRTYADHVTQLFALPYFIGWHHCGYIRGLRKPYLEALQKGDTRTAKSYEDAHHTYREGFFSELEEPITPLLVPLSQALRDSEKVHADAKGK
jgi:hypothetical protein